MKIRFAKEEGNLSVLGDHGMQIRFAEDLPFGMEFFEGTTRFHEAYHDGKEFTDYNDGEYPTEGQEFHVYIVRAPEELKKDVETEFASLVTIEQPLIHAITGAVHYVKLPDGRAELAFLSLSEAEWFIAATDEYLQRKNFGWRGGDPADAD